MKPLAISPGDPAGVGPEITVRAVADRRDLAVVICGDADWLAARFEARGIATHAHRSDHPYAVGEVGLVDCARWSEDLVGARGPTAAGGRAQIAGLDAAIDRVIAGEASALVTGPTSKEAVVSGGTPFTGQTEHLAARSGLASDDVTMLFLGPRLRVGLATTHLAVRDAVDAITVPRVVRTIRHLGEALRCEGIPRPRLVVTGLNPHAGEGGLFGHEEQRVVGPACETVRAASFAGEIIGPMGAETAFRLAAAGEIDGVATMLHDQATIASKLLDWGEAVNVTWGLPFLRASVDHGVAYDAAAGGNADPSGMAAAIACGVRLADNTVTG